MVKKYHISRSDGFSLAFSTKAEYDAFKSDEEAVYEKYLLRGNIPSHDMDGGHAYIKYTILRAERDNKEVKSVKVSKE